MFKLELIDLLNKYKKTSDKHEIENIKSSLKKLIQENKDQFNEFINSGNLTPSQEKTLNEIDLDNNVKEQEASEEDNDLNKIKKTFEKWVEFYESNNQQVNENCMKIVDDLIKFYAPKRFSVLKKTLEIEDVNPNFKDFKGLLKNRLRLYFISKLEEYENSDKFTKLGFFKKAKKEIELSFLYLKIGNYNFDTNKIEEVIE